MPDGEDADEALVLVELVDDPVGANAKRAQPAKASSNDMTCLGFAFDEPEGPDDGIRQGPVELEDLLAGAPGELDLPHLRVSTVELSAKLVECHGLPPLDLLPSFLDGDERLGIGEDLSGLFQGVVLVDRDEHGRRPAPTGDDDMLPEIGDLIDDLAEFAAKHTDWDRLAHG
jgi:hypothetical protein